MERLEELIELAGDALDQDPKLDQLVAEIAAIRKQEPKANILVYTEYVDSQRAAVQALKAVPGIGTVLTMCGDDNDKARQADHRAVPRRSEDMILVSTDAAAEGLNLHQRCHHLIHLELPFNPNRLEQRNGRIDRYGQQHEPIVRYFFLRGTFEDRILLRLIAKYERQRARLTFVPNTLGLTTSSDAAQARLLTGIMDEDTKLFREEPTLFDFREGDEAEGADPATKELLEEIDRSLKGFEQAARTNTWLGEAGLNADEKLLTEASEARAAGRPRRRRGPGRVRLRCRAARRRPTRRPGRRRSLSAPPAARLAVRAGRPARLRPREGRRAPDDQAGRHQRRRRATRSATSAAPIRWCAGPWIASATCPSAARLHKAQDPRASAVQADVPEPTLLYTFLGRVSSRAGRELERVLAVQVGRPARPRSTTAPISGRTWPIRKKAIRTTDLWKKHFAAWAADCRRSCPAGRRRLLPPHRRGFRRRAATDRSRRNKRPSSSGWPSGPRRSPARSDGPVQRGLFDQTAALRRRLAAPAWWSITDPEQRLAAFGSDGSQPPAKRSEADGVLRIHEKRKKILDALLDLGAAADRAAGRPDADPGGEPCRLTSATASSPDQPCRSRSSSSSWRRN